MEMLYPTDLRLDPEDIEQRGVLRWSKDGEIKSRIGGMVSIYFLEGWRKDKRQALLDILAEYIALFPDKAIYYQREDEKRLRRRRDPGLPEDYRGLAELGEDDDLHMSMQYFDRNQSDDPSLWLITVSSFRRDNPSHALSGLKVYFPPSFIFADPDGFVTRIARWCGRLDSLHGSGGLGVLTVPGSELFDRAWHYPLLQAYPALEYDAMGSYWAQAEDFGDLPKGRYKLPRSSNWLTILGAPNVELLGGKTAIAKKLDPGMEVHRYDDGVVVRAGRLPALGNAETNGVAEAYRCIARIIKPIRFEGYRYGVIKEPVPVKGPQVTLDWIRRFD